MDKIDRAIISHLIEDGRLSNFDLAARIGLSPFSCPRRVRKLKQDSVIEGYHATVNDDAMGRGLKVTAHVDLSPIESKTIQAFEKAVIALPEIVECRRMMGTPDYVMLIAVADLADYQKLYADELSALPGIATIRSHIAMRTIKSR